VAFDGAILEEGSGCVVMYFSDTECKTQAGNAFSPSINQCMDLDGIEPGDAQILSMMLQY